MNKLITFLKELIIKIIDFFFPKSMFILADGDTFTAAENKIFYSKGE